MNSFLRGRGRGRLRQFFLLTSSLTLAISVLSADVAMANPSANSPEITICLKNATSYCADIEGAHNASGATVYLYNKSFSRDYHWYEVPVPCTSFLCQPGCGNASCFAFEDAQDTSLCLAAGVPETGSAELISCDIGLGGTPRATWIQDGNEIRNLFYAPGLLATGEPQSGQRLYVQNLSQGLWQAWTGP
jgi:hypothetical protein